MHGFYQIFGRKSWGVLSRIWEATPPQVGLLESLVHTLAHLHCNLHKRWKKNGLILFVQNVNFRVYCLHCGFINSQFLFLYGNLSFRFEMWLQYDSTQTVFSVHKNRPEHNECCRDVTRIRIPQLLAITLPKPLRKFVLIVPPSGWVQTNNNILFEKFLLRWCLQW